MRKFKKKLNVKVISRTLNKAKPLEKLGAHISNSLGEAVKDTDIIITMLTDDEAVEKVLGDKEFLNNLKSSSTVIDMSSIKPKIAIQHGKILKEKGIYFLDHSPGNTLVKIAGDSYKFYLVDLNRMEFKTLSFNERIQNFSRLTPDRNVISILSKEYARCIGADPDFIFERMWISTKKFQYNFHKKKRLKKSIRFWKN